MIIASAHVPLVPLGPNDLLVIIIHIVFVLGIVFIYQYINPPVQRTELFELHAGIWWGGLRLLAGLAYSITYRLGRIATEENPQP